METAAWRSLPTCDQSLISDSRVCRLKHTYIYGISHQVFCCGFVLVFLYALVCFCFE